MRIVDRHCQQHHARHTEWIFGPVAHRKRINDDHQRPGHWHRWPNIKRQAIPNNAANAQHKKRGCPTRSRHAPHYFCVTRF